LFTEKPSIDLSGIKDITVKAGETIKIALPLKGWPIPTANWTLGDKDVIKDDRTKIEVTHHFIALIIINRAVWRSCCPMCWRLRTD